MRIALTCSNLKKRLLNGHAGRTARYLVFEVDGDQITEVEPIRLPREQIPHNYFHTHGGVGPNALFDTIDVLIVGSAGGHFINRTAQMGVKTLITDETDPETAVKAFLAGTLNTIDADHHHHHHDHDHHHHHHHDHD